MGRTLATLMFTLMVVVVTNAAETGKTWNGWVSDVRCGATVDAACAKKYASTGLKASFVNSDKTVFRVTNPDLIKAHEGDHVIVNGKLERGVLTVASVNAFGETKADVLPATTTWNGWVSDVRCGAAVDSACAKKCARACIKVAFVNSDKAIFQVANPDSLKGHEGDHVTVNGKLDNKVLTVASVQAFNENKAAK